MEMHVYILLEGYNANYGLRFWPIGMHVGNNKILNSLFFDMPWTFDLYGISLDTLRPRVEFLVTRALSSPGERYISAVRGIAPKVTYRLADQPHWIDHQRSYVRLGNPGPRQTIRLRPSAGLWFGIV